MKRLRTLIAAVLIAVAPVAIVATQTGCTNVKGVVYKTLAATAYSVDTGLRAYADQVVAGKVTAAHQAKVRDAKRQYEVAMKAAIETAQFNFQAPTPESLTALANLLLTTISEVTQ